MTTKVSTDHVRMFLSMVDARTDMDLKIRIPSEATQTDEKYAVEKVQELLELWVKWCGL